jgi:hypothetical protein
MDEREQRDLARHLADTSEVLDFEGALRIVKFRPADVDRLLRMREEMAKREKERQRLRARRKLALREEFG